MLVFSLDRGIAHNRLPKINRGYSLLHITQDKLDILVRKGRMTVEQMQLFNNFKRLLEESGEEFDLQLGFNARWESYENEYGLNSHLEDSYFVRFTVSVIYVIIRYPQLTITNEKEQSLVLKDLFVRHTFTFDGSLLAMHTSFEGTRTTISPFEYAAQYEHSHLKKKLFEDSNGLCKFTSFCTGGQAESIRVLIHSLNEHLSEGVLDEDEFSLLIHHTRTYVEWESLEGGPHNFMSNVVGKDFRLSDIGASELQHYMSLVMMKIRSGMYPEFNWRFRGGRYCINDDENLEDFLYTCIRWNIREVYGKDERGEYFRQSMTNVDTRGINENYWLVFKGQKFFFRVEGSSSLFGERKNYIHPKIKEYVKQRLEFYINSHYTKQAGIKAVNTIKY